ncbi:Lrp/AsnC family transcriptional regulator [Roseateles oligotrophus]|uniref:Lrp/AsnC family transcriptional regulator n=1 Tax=Roseateles oligotrophus TaxID=1769250 RepID=A0ABT2YA44_9BURK|nr:Lrp/AsnC family transcriptional regulator [Roseateles oligotrophus]MCV2367171.1 Lrp/AsnC family transcriptional regulator [Roseateles oligotrophus]
MDNDFDSHDHRILAELQADARLTMAELGRRVHLSQPAVTERVRKLEDLGVISGYQAIVNSAKLGYAIRAVIRVGRCDEARVLRALEASPEVLTAFNVTGEDSWILEIAVRDVAHLEQVLQRYCSLAETSTAIILRCLREHAPLRPVPPLVEAASGDPEAAPKQKKTRRSGSSGSL